MFDKKKIREESILLGYVDLKGFDKPMGDYRALWDELENLKRKHLDLRIDNSHLEAKVEKQKKELKRRSAFKHNIQRGGIEWQRDKSIRMYSDLTDEHNKLCTDNYRLGRELKEIKIERDSLVNKLCLSEKILTDFVGDKKTRDKLIDKYRESIREWDTIFTDKERLESKVTKLKESKEERDKMKEGLRTQKRTITKESLEDLIKQYYNFETVRIGKILVGTQTPTLYPGSSKLELDIQYTKEESEE